MKPARYSGGLSHEGAEAISESLDSLLTDYQVYHQNLRKLNWNHRLRLHLDLGRQLDTLYQEVDHGSDYLADRIMELGYDPTTSPSTALLYTQLQPAEAVESFEEATRLVIQNAQQLLKQLQQTYQLAAEYKDQRTLVMLAELARFLHHTIWLFSAIRSAKLN
jgi:starvation-inducible DNA-binding protein